MSLANYYPVKKNFFSFIYFAIFSDVVGAAIISNDDKDSLVKIDTETIFSRKDTSRDSYKKAKIVYQNIPYPQPKKLLIIG